MPEISIGSDDRDSSRLVFSLLPGEDPNNLLQTAFTVEAVASYVYDYRRSPETFSSTRKIRKAKEKLATILPTVVSADLIQALINNEIGTKATFKLKKEKEWQGFELQGFERVK